MLSSVLEAGATAVNWTDQSPVLPELPSWQGKSDQDRLPSVKQSSGMAAGLGGGRGPFRHGVRDGIPELGTE